MARSAEVLAIGIAAPIGLSARAVAAAARAGICRCSESRWRNRLFEPQVLSMLADEHLPPLAPALSGARLSPTVERLARLGTWALREATAPCTEPPPLLLAVQEERPGGLADLRGLPGQLAAQAGVELDLRDSRIYRQGGAGGHAALQEALDLLARDRHPYVLVGGVDTFKDSRRLAERDAEGRLHGSSLDGFVPGEAAAFLLLGTRSLRRRLGLAPLARVTGVGLGLEKGHRYSPEPYRGDGLSQAFRALFRALPPGTPPIRSVYAGFNGESMPAKEWGVARLRSRRWFVDDEDVQHPADCVGDAGAALGPLMLVLAADGIQRGYREDPSLVWSTSDRELRGAALLQAAVP